MVRPCQNTHMTILNNFLKDGDCALLQPCLSLRLFGFLAFSDATLLIPAGTSFTIFVRIQRETLTSSL